ncbi:MAG: ABC transporter permease [Paramuribaculum sp.]|nr:ABC transporter permease [Paramuribaculum sp.]
MGIFLSLVKKETIHVVRDTRTMLITMIMPLVLLLLFGFTISTEVNSVRLVAVVDRHTDMTRDILQRFQVNDYFDFRGLSSPSEVESLLRCGKIDAALILRPDDGKLNAQVIVDASNTTSAQAITGYIQGVLSGNNSPSPVLTYTLYNPQMKSAYNFVPGIMGMIFILICAIMASVSIVREKESGTMNLLLVSPIRPRTVIFGKLVPYFLLSCIILAVMLVMSYTVLDMPMSSGIGKFENVTNVIMLSLIYIVLSLSLGLLISTIADTQISALMASAVALMMPIITLSGMIFPIDNMPVVLQGLSCAIPARWFIEAMRKLMIRQLSIGYVLKELIILSAMTVVLLIIAIRKFQSGTR